MQNKATPEPSSGGFRLVMAGGGTGGHLFPAIAIAQAFRLRHPGNRVLFVNAGRSLETRVLSELGWEQKAISPKVRLEATHERALDIVPLDILKQHAEA
jgi:uncharacterized protein (DUF2237 family)